MLAIFEKRQIDTGMIWHYPFRIMGRNGSRSSRVFVVSILGGSIAVMGLGLFLATRLFAVEKQEALISSQPFFANEAFVIRELRREAEAEIRRRDEAIAEYLQRIEDLEAREMEVREEFAAERRRFEAALRRELAAGAEGAPTEEEIRERLAAFDERQAIARGAALESLATRRDEAARLLEEEDRLRSELVEELDELETEEPGGVSQSPPAFELSLVQALQGTIRRLEDELRRYRQEERVPQPSRGSQGGRSPEGASEAGFSAAGLSAAGRRDGEAELAAEVLDLLETVERSGSTPLSPEELAENPELGQIQEAVDRLLEPYRVAETRSYRRIASVSLVTEGELSAEIIGAGRPPEGATVEIRRRIDNNRELRVARGRVVSVGGERMVIDVTTLMSPERPPQVLDTVYLEE